MRREALVLFLLASTLPLLGSPAFSFASSASSANFKIETGAVDSGGGAATSSGFNLKSSFGQPGGGVSTSTTFRLRGGFLNFPNPAPSQPSTPPSPPPSPPPVIVAGGAAFYTPPVKPGKPAAPPKCPSATVDLNCDNRVDFIDLSILLYYYGSRGPKFSMYDFNGNGVVDFPDISIMMYYWTD